MNKSLWIVLSRMYKTFDCVLEEQRRFRIQER